jgi:hypothetical protein
MRFWKREMRTWRPEMHNSPTDSIKMPPNYPQTVCNVFHKVVNTCGKLRAVDNQMRRIPVLTGFSSVGGRIKFGFPQQMLEKYRKCVGLSEENKMPCAKTDTGILRQRLFCR